MEMSQIHLGVMTFVLVSELTISSVQGNVVVFGLGRCPRIAGMKDFDASRYVGKWYEYERFGNWFERNLKCVYANYEENSDGSIAVENGGIDTRSDEEESVEARATVPNDKRPGELKVRFSRFDRSRKPNYIVVDTDYDDYAVVFSCFQIPFLRFLPFHVQFAWILTRDRGVAPSNLESLKDSLKDKKVRTSKFLSIEQSGCSN